MAPKNSDDVCAERPAEHNGERLVLVANSAYQPRKRIARVSALEAELESLRTQVRHSRLILDQGRDHAIMLMDSNGRVTGINAGAETMLGYDQIEMLGRFGDLVLTAETRSSGKFGADLRRAAEDGQAVHDGWHLRKNGKRFWANGVLTPMLDGGGRARGFTHVLRDRASTQAETDRRASAELNLVAEYGGAAPAEIQDQGCADSADPADRTRAAGRDRGPDRAL